MVDEQRKVRVETTKDRITYVDDEGARHEYREETTRELRLTIDKLQLVEGFRQCGEEDAKESPAAELFGVATLEDEGLVVVAQPETRGHKVSIHIRAWTEAQTTAWDEMAVEKGVAPCWWYCSLSYNAHDWEVGNEAGWWTSLLVSPDVFRLVRDAVESRNMQTMEVGLMMKGLYADDWFALRRDGVTWYLPTEEGRQPSSATMARCYVSSLSVGLASIDLAPPVEQLPPPEESATDQPVTVEPPSHDEAAPLKQDAVAVAIDKLSDSVRSLGSALKWVGGFVVLCLLWIAMK